MVGLGTPAMLSTGICIIHMVLILVRQRIWCRGLFQRFALVAAMVLWLVGTILYIVTYMRVESNASQTSIEEGFALAIAMALLQIGHCVLGNIAISKLL